MQAGLGKVGLKQGECRLQRVFVVMMYSFYLSERVTKKKKKGRKENEWGLDSSESVGPMRAAAIPGQAEARNWELLPALPFGCMVPRI